MPQDEPQRPEAENPPAGAAAPSPGHVSPPAFSPAAEPYPRHQDQVPESDAPPAPKRGTHLAWARLSDETFAAAPAAPPVATSSARGSFQAPPSDTAPTVAIAHPGQAARIAGEAPAPVAEPAVRPVRPMRPAVPRDDAAPGALGRLVAVVITCGVAGAILVAAGLWLLTVALSRLAG